MHWHTTGARWCNHGHLVPPAGAEIIVANQRGDAWMYIDRESTNGVILAASNIDVDTHAFHHNSTAQMLMERLLAWGEAEAEAALERRAVVRPRIAGLFSGVHFQRGFYEDEEFGPQFAVVPAEELAGIDLDRYAALWVPRESNQGALVRHRMRIADYLARGGTLVSFDEVNQRWLDGVTWVHRRVDVGTLTLQAHPFLEGIEKNDVTWHAHGVFTPPVSAVPLITEAEGGAVLYLDDQRHAPGRILMGTIDPDCHTGYGSDRPRPLLRAIMRWVFAEKPEGVATLASAADRR